MHRALAFALFVPLAACNGVFGLDEGHLASSDATTNGDSGHLSDTGNDFPDTGLDDDTGTFPDETSVVDAPDDASDGSITDTARPCDHPVVNEVMLKSSSDPFGNFVELYNACDAPFVLTGMELRGFYPAGASPASDQLVPLDGYTMPPKSFLTFAQVGADISADDNYPQSVGTYLGVAIVDSSGKIVDGVGWAASGATEEIPASYPAADQSIIRYPDGTDYDDNGNDFKVTMDPTPGGANDDQPPNDAG